MMRRKAELVNYDETLPNEKKGNEEDSEFNDLDRNLDSIYDDEDDDDDDHRRIKKDAGEVPDI